MPTIIGGGVLYAIALVLVGVVGAAFDVYVFDHFDRGLGRGISFNIMSWFAPLAALLSTPGYVLGLSYTRHVPRRAISFVAGALVALASWLLMWTTLLFVDIPSAVTTTVAAVSYLAGGFVAALIAKAAHASPQVAG